MKLFNPGRHQGDKLDREAADWVVRWEDGERPSGTKEQSRWIGWLQRSPHHVQAYFHTADLYERLGRIDPHNRIDVDEWLAGHPLFIASIARPQPAAVAAPREAFTRPATRARRTRRRFVAAAAVFLVLIVGALGWQLYGGETYRTAIGQQSIYGLADGSMMTLNTRSRARVLFSDTTRLIELEGEALFAVARDPARPFYVRTQGAVVRVLGTTFNVYEQTGETRVSVVEGRVQVSSGSNVSQPPASAPGAHADPNAASTAGMPQIVALSAGEAARISAGRVSKQAVANLDAAVAWQRQKLVFEDAALTEVAAQFNRYNRAQIRIEGQAARNKRLSGTFDAMHPHSLLLYLRKDADLTVEAASEDFVVKNRGPGR